MVGGFEEGVDGVIDDGCVRREKEWASYWHGVGHFHEREREKRDVGAKRKGFSFS